MINSRIIYNLIADILEYPDDALAGKAFKCAELLSGDYPAAAKKLNKFVDSTKGESLGHLEEVYTATFDINPMCSLDVGYQLFGENFKRSKFMVKLKQSYKEHDFDSGNGLPDYLPTMLRFLSGIDDEQIETSLLKDCIVPALSKMEGNFDKKKNYFRLTISAVQVLFESQLAERGDN